MRKLKILVLAILCVFAIATAFAFTRTAVTPQTLKGPYTGTVNANDLLVTWTAADAVNLNQFLANGNEILLVWNTDVSSQTITLTSRTDSFGRSGDVSAYSMATNTVHAFNFRNASSGWVQADGNVYFQASSANVKFAVIRIN